MINGKQSRFVDVSDRGFQYGDGLFETLLIRRQTPLFLSPHLERLRWGCAKLSIPFPDERIVRAEIDRLCKEKHDGVLKIQLTRGVGGRGYQCPDFTEVTRVLSFHPLPDHPVELKKQGVRVVICQTRLGINPALAGIKHMNRLEQILARQEWNDPEIREGLMLDAEDCVVEGTMSNVFLVKNSVVYTPLIDRCGVAGIMRALVLEIARKKGMETEQRRIKWSDVLGADELFLTNSLIGVWPINRVNDFRFSVGSVTQQMTAWIEDRIEQELKVL